MAALVVRRYSHEEKRLSPRKGVLRHLTGILGAAAHPQCQPVHRPFVGHHQLLEGVCVTVSGTGDPLLLGHFRSLLIPAVMRSISSSVFIRTICSL